MKYFVDNLKIASWYLLPARGPGHRRSGIRMSELLMTPSLLRAAISCHHGSGAEYRRFSTKKWNGIWRYAWRPLLVFDLLQENPLWLKAQMSSFSSVVYNKGWGSEATQLSGMPNVSTPWRHQARPVRGRETINTIPVFMFTGRRVGQQPRVVPLLSPRACGLNVTLREASEGAGRLNVSSILARRQPRLRAGDTRQSLQPS